MYWIIGALLVLFVLVVVLAQKHTYVIQYLFFCRFPLIIAIILAVLLPWGMCSWARSSLGNLAVLTPVYVALVAMAATLAAWAVLLATARILLWVPRYADLWFYRSETPPPLGNPLRHPLRWARAASERIVGFGYETILDPRRPGLVKWRRLVLYFVLALPLILVTVVRSTQEAGGGSWKVLAALIGIACAVAIRFGGAQLSRMLTVDGFLRDWITRPRLVKRAIERVKVHAGAVVQELDQRRPVGFARIADADVEQPVLLRRTAEGVGFFALVGVFFILVGILLNPARTEAGPSLPVVIMVLLVLLFVFTAFSALVDKLRVPVLLLVVAITFTLFRLFGIDHYYEVKALPVQKPLANKANGPTARDLYRLWRSQHPATRFPVPVIVTASGGGITAALWTAEVLARLQTEAPAFGHALLAVSSVSGGGVGAMYFVDGYSAGQPPSGNKLTEIKRSAGASSLLATTWGFAYRDIWWSLPIFSRTNDRGLALERSWRRRLDAPDLTLRRWQQEVGISWRPPQIFNATTVETGERFLLMPLRLGPEARVSHTLGRQADPEPESAASRWDVRNFLDLYPEADLEIVTAARLSATFPFVSPISRPQRFTVPDGEAFHLADGGYFDNHGIATAVDLLRDVLPLIAAERDSTQAERADAAARGETAGTIPRVVLVQIRVAGVSEPDARRNAGYLYATIGPVQTLMKVRTASQVGRNSVEIELLREAWSSRIDLQPFIFELGEQDAPLSWHLIESEKERIQKGWTSGHGADARRLAELLSSGSRVDVHDP